MLILLSRKSPLLSIVRSIVYFNAYFVDLLMFSEMVSMLRNHLHALPLLAKITWGAFRACTCWLRRLLDKGCFVPMTTWGLVIKSCGKLRVRILVELTLPSMTFSTPRTSLSKAKCTFSLFFRYKTLLSWGYRCALPHPQQMASDALHNLGPW